MADRRFLYMDSQGMYQKHKPSSDSLIIAALQVGSGLSANAGGLSVSGGLDLNTTKVTNMATCTVATDGANKGYVDDASTSTAEKIQELLPSSQWISLVTGFSVEPTLIQANEDTPTAGEVWQYTYSGGAIRYRFIADDDSIDAFYETYVGEVLGNLVTQKGIVI